MTKSVRLLPEWERTEYILLALPAEDTDWQYVLDDALAQYRRLLEAFISQNQKCIVLCRKAEDVEALTGGTSDLVFPVVVPYNDTWTRDYGPITVERHDRLRALDFGFNGWGLKFASDRDNLVNLQFDKIRLFIKDVYRNERDFVLEGGSIETDGEGTLLTTTHCLTSPNRNGGKSKQELNDILQQRLGADHVLWLDFGALEGDDTDSHIDTLARMAPGNTILFVGCRDMDDPHFEEMLRMRAQLTLFRNRHGDPYNLVELPMPDAIYDSDGMRLPATYANYLVANNVIYMPVYGQPANDTLACQTVRIAYPDHKIVPVDCTTLILQHGSLHCATMQIPYGVIGC